MTAVDQVVVLSLEAWDEVWRRNQLLVDALLRDSPNLRVLFTEPPVPGLRNLLAGKPTCASRRTAPSDARIMLLRPVEWIPDRLLAHLSPQSGQAVVKVARDVGFDHPVLWINNHSLARFALGTGWPVVYDITDDWLLADLPKKKRRRAELDDELLMRRAAAVVVCSPALARSRSSRRDVVLIPNGVDIAHLTAPQPRPGELGTTPVAVYAGTLHDERLDVPLCCKIADDVPDVTFIYVGPDSLLTASREALTRRANVRLIGSRPYSVVPAYLQHADVIVIPHVVTPFTESLDPIKARECLAVGTPTVATPVAGFRDLGPPVRVASPQTFGAAMRDALNDPKQPAPPADLWTWADAAREFRAVLEKTIG